MKDLKRVLELNGVEVDLAGFYVDDIRLVTGLIPPGVRWSREAGRLTFDVNLMEEDIKNFQL